MKSPIFPIVRQLTVSLAILMPNFLHAAPFQLEEVLVTAQKKTESAQDIPVSITAISENQLDKLKLRSAYEIVASAPNVVFNGTAGQSQLVLSIRGVSMQDYASNQAGPVAVYVDEVFRGSQLYSQGIQLFDLERVEVLRGPQGTLYGRNSTGGAVNFITKRPSFGESTGYLGVGIGNYDGREAEGAYETDLVKDVLAIRGAFTYTERNGFVKNKTPGVDDLGGLDEWAFRVGVSYQPHEDVNAFLSLHKSQTDAPAIATMTEETSPDGIGFTGYTRDGLDFYETSENRGGYVKQDSEGVSLRVDWNFSEAFTMTSITSYDEADTFSAPDDDGSPFNILHDDYAADGHQWTQDLRLVSEFDGLFNFIAGVYYGDDVLNGRTINRFLAQAFGVNNFCLDDPGGLIGCAYENQYKQDRESIAAYVHTTTELTSQLSLTLGLRYTKDTVGMSDYTSLLSDVLTGVSNPAFGGVPIPVFSLENPGEEEENNLSGKVGLEYHFEDDAMAYISYSTGYRVGSWNGLAFFFPEEVTYANPEELEAWEIGFKSQLLEGRLQVNGSVFTYDYTDQQFINFNPYNGAQTIENAPKSSIRGFELEATFLPLENFQIQSGLGYLDGEYDEFVKSGVDLSGNDLITSPELNFNTSIDYDVDVGNLNLALHVDAVYTDDQFYSPENQEAIAQDGYLLVNARAVLESEQYGLSLGLWAKNIGDKEFVVNSFDLSGFGYNFYQLGEARTYGVDLTWRF